MNACRWCVTLGAGVGFGGGLAVWVWTCGVGRIMNWSKAAKFWGDRLPRIRPWGCQFCSNDGSNKLSALIAVCDVPPIFPLCSRNPSLLPSVVTDPVLDVWFRIGKAEACLAIGPAAGWVSQLVCWWLIVPAAWLIPPCAPPCWFGVRGRCGDWRIVLEDWTMGWGGLGFKACCKCEFWKSVKSPGYSRWPLCNRLKGELKGWSRFCRFNEKHKIRS